MAVWLSCERDHYKDHDYEVADLAHSHCHGLCNGHEHGHGSCNAYRKVKGKA